MKTILKVALLFFSLKTFGQKTGELTLSQAKVAEAKIIYDLIDDIPKDCKVKSFSLTAKIGGKIKEFPGSGREFSKSFRTFLQKAESGNKIFIDDIDSSCPKSHKKNYAIVVQ